MDEKKTDTDLNFTASVSVTDTENAKNTVNVEKIGNAVRVSVSKP